jgi:uroporphyrinogen III methyltransferase/synthase
VIELAPLDDYSALDACIARLGDYDWVIFTSVNAVSYFFSRNVDARAIRGRICAIGPATASLLREMHLHADLVPEESTSEGVAAAFSKFPMGGARVLLPRAAAAREVIPDALGSMGAHVDVADAYRNIVPANAANRIEEYKRSERRAQWITFTSGSTVNNWLKLAGPESLEGLRIASIGPATSDVIRRHGLGVDAEANPHTVTGLINAILRCQAPF